MKITIELPDVEYDMFVVRDILEKNNLIPDEYKDGWTNKLHSFDDHYILDISRIEDGEIFNMDIPVFTNELNDMFLNSINYFEYDGRYGAMFELTSDEKPSFSSYYKDGTLKTFS